MPISLLSENKTCKSFYFNCGDAAIQAHPIIKNLAQTSYVMHGMLHDWRLPAQLLVKTGREVTPARRRPPALLRIFTT